MEAVIKMNSYDRVMATLRHQEPDRVPLAELLISPALYTKLLPGAGDICDFYDAFDYDVVIAPAFYESIARTSSGYTDEWGITYATTDEGDTHHPVGHPLKGVRSLGGFAPPIAGHTGRLGRLPDFVKRYKGKKAVAYAMRAGFLWASALMSMEDMLIAMYEDEDFIDALFDRIFDEQTKIARNAVRAGADLVFETDDYAYNRGPLISPAMFERFISPRLKKLVDAVHDEGGLLIKHTDGNVEKLLDAFIDCGIDGLHSLDPAAGMDIGAIKRKYGKRISLWGNVECGRLMCFGTPLEVDEAVKNCVRAAAPGGGYVLTSSNSLIALTKPENLLALFDALKKYGAYPIQLD